MDTDYELYFVRYPDRRDYLHGEQPDLLINGLDVVNIGIEYSKANPPTDPLIGAYVYCWTEQLIEGSLSPLQKMKLSFFCAALRIVLPEMLFSEYGCYFSGYLEGKGSDVSSIFMPTLDDYFNVTVKSVAKEWKESRDDFISRKLFLLVDLFEFKKINDDAINIFLSRYKEVGVLAPTVRLQKELKFPKEPKRFKSIYRESKQFYIKLFGRYPHIKPDFKQYLNEYDIETLNRLKYNFTPHVQDYIAERYRNFKTTI